MSSWAPLALTLLTGALTALPVTPALYELLKRADDTPLPTSRHDGRIDNFAEVFRSRMEPLFPQLNVCHDKAELSRISIERMEVLLVGAHDFGFHSSLMQNIDAVMLSKAALIPAGQVIDADIYASELLMLGERSALRAALGRVEVILGKNSAVLRWLHADGSIHLLRGSNSYGRLSASQAIHLEPACGFERMYAPRIIVGSDLDNCHEESSLPTTLTVRESPATMEMELDDMFAANRQRVRVTGDFILPAGETLNANVIATRDVRIGAGSRLFGSSKSYRDTVLEPGASVHGSIVCGGSLRLAAQGFVAGPVMAEGDVFIGQGSRVGAPDALTTVSSNGARLAAGCQLHGTVWARARGTVEG